VNVNTLVGVGGDGTVQDGNFSQSQSGRRVPRERR
jgi:hypothetical protein